MKIIFLFLFYFTTHFLCLQTYAQPNSVFALDTEGWITGCDGSCSAPFDNWSAVNGNPSGCYKGTDNSSGTWYFYSSPSFNTDISSYYGQSLNFDLKQNTNLFQTNEPDVMLCKSADTMIVYSTSVNPGNIWTSYSVPLSETGWKYNDLSGASVTYADMISFLSNIYYIKIRGDYSLLTTETSWLDNVNISDVILLPIQLSEFRGEIKNINSVLLSWKTLSETSCNYFQIEKSINGAMSFDSIGVKNAFGTTSVQQSYDFYDEYFETPAYYRLKITDNNMHSYYSEIISVIDAPAPTISLYPNPASNQCTIENKSGSFSSCIITVVDSYKKIIMYNYPTGSSEKATLDVSSFPNGIYYVSIINSTSLDTYPLLVIH
ncbi:MAG: laminin B domain-containing protein [Chitinophagales bacterium]